MMFGFCGWASAEPAALMTDASAPSVRTARCHNGVLFTVASFWLRVEELPGVMRFLVLPATLGVNRTLSELGHSETQTDEYLHMGVMRQRHARPRSLCRNRTLVPLIRYRSSFSRSTGADHSTLVP